ncbi:SKG-like transmembrane protein [Streptomyces sp. NBC_00234]|uniref:DUF6479 family protein n=1 Tax=Streptomyces sp. NBC_00234 TaxID=2903638 RepID=UPI002E292FE9|nr:DUF6479 family protein [Streptomyces sp. NBC_00234]
MDVTNGAQSSFTLADSAGAIGVVMPIVGIAVVALLIGAFWWGRRRRDEQPPAPRPDEQPLMPDHRTHIEEAGKHGSDHFPEDGRGLSPYALGDHGNEVIPPDTEPPRETR